MTFRRVFFIVLNVVFFCGVPPTHSAVVADPFGFSAGIEVGAQSEITLTMNNTGEEEVAFQISDYLIEEDEERRQGPLRDDPGDVVADFETPYNWILGMAWDVENQLMWGLRFNIRPYHLCALNPDNGEFEEDFEVNVDCKGMFIREGVLYGDCERDRNVYRWDLEGNRLETFAAPNGMAMSNNYVATDGVHLFANTNGAVQVYENFFEQQNMNQIATINCAAQVGGARLGPLVWVPEHPNGPLWVSSGDRFYQFAVDVEWNCELLQNLDVQWDAGVINSGFTHDSENLWWAPIAEAHWYVIDDGVREMRLLTLEPREGVIPAQDEVDIIASIDATDVPEGVYNFLLELSAIAPDDEEPTLVELSALISVEVPTASLSGGVTDLATGEVIERVQVDLDQYLITRYTDVEGEYSFTELPPADYQLTFTAPDFLPLTLNVGLEDDLEDADVALLHSECSLDREDIVADLPVDGQLETVVTVSNNGNGPLTFMTDRRLLGDANADPWELRVDYPAGVVTEDSRIQGAVYIDDLFYLSGANNREPLIYVLNRDQEVVNQFAQHGEGRYGYKDLAWDGELIWGSGERVIYGFTPDGEEVTSFDSGISPCNNLAWDTDREILWGSGTTTDIIGYDRDGNVVGEVARGEYRVYGLAYWPDDPDGHQLYVFHKINEVGDLMIAKLNIDNGETMDVVSLEHEAGGVAQGCFITNQYDIYSWVFMGVANSGAEDRIDIWQIDARKDWMSIDPTEGVIEAEELLEFVVTLDATDLPQALFEGEIVFLHDGIGGETHLPITLQVGDGQGGGPEELVIELANGWNMVSSFVQPDPDDIIEIMAGLVEAESLIMVKNGAGQFYNPQFGFNNIPGWAVEEGYMIKMDGADELTLAGEPVRWNQPIALDAGWQMISYYPRQGVDAILALSGIVDVLLMAKDGAGRFYSPAFGFSNMGDMIAGMGYLVKMDEAAELIYTVEEEFASQPSPYLQPNILPVHSNTGVNMSLLVQTDISAGEIGVYANGNLVGSGVIQDGKCGIAVWGDDKTTVEKDGLFEGEGFVLKYMDSNTERETELEVLNILAGSGLVYETNSFLVSNVSQKPDIPQDYYLNLPYPNPFNNITKIEYGLSEAGPMSMKVFDLSGRLVKTLISKEMKSGRHSIAWKAENVTSGLYLIHLDTNQKKLSTKVVLAK